MTELHFVSELAPGHQRNKHEASKIRSHVRRAVFDNRRRADLSKRLRTYEMNSDGRLNVNTKNNRRKALQVQPQLTVLHPYTTAAAALLPLSTSRVDGLFKGRKLVDTS